MPKIEIKKTYIGLEKSNNRPTLVEIFISHHIVTYYLESKLHICGILFQ